MDLLDALIWQAGDIGLHIESEILRGDIDIVDVEQEAAAGASGDLAQEFGLCHGRAGKADIRGEVFNEDAPSERLLCLLDIAADDGKRFLIMRQRHEIVQIDTVADAPGKM